MKTSLIYKKILALSFLCLPLFAYAQTSYTESEISEKTILQNKSKTTISVNSLQSQLKDNTLQVAAGIQNSSGQKVHLYYRVLWHNDQKQQLSADAWKPALLLPNKSFTINAQAPLSNVVDFTIEFNVD